MPNDCATHLFFLRIISCLLSTIINDQKVLPTHFSHFWTKAKLLKCPTYGIFWIYTIIRPPRVLGSKLQNHYYLVYPKTPKLSILEEATAYKFKRGRQSRRITVQCTVHTEMCYCGTSKACEHYQVQGQSSHCCHELTIHNKRWFWGGGARNMNRNPSIYNIIHLDDGTKEFSSALSL